MKDVSDVVACVIDRGTFFPVAERLAEGFKKVYYYRPNGESFKTVAGQCLGSGHPTVDYTTDFWRIKKEIDLFVFPDCNVNDVGAQLELESQGFPVWGSKEASDLEERRGLWMDKCEELGLPMPRTERVKGLTALEDYLWEHRKETLFVKISWYRGDMETWEAKEWAQIQNKLAVLRMKFGPVSEEMIFYVQLGIDTDIESGSDTYNIFGEYPDEVIIGYEKKNESYYGTIRKATEMPEEVWLPAKAIQPTLRQLRYANFISSEIRIADGKSHWLDPCFRCPSPAGEEELLMYANFPEIVWRGAHGELVQPEWAATFCGEAVISYCGDREGWKSIVVPEEVRRYVKLYANIGHDGAFHYPPAQEPECIGCAIGMGDNPEDVVDRLKEIEEALKACPVELHITPMADLFKEIEEAEDEGIEFSDQPVPEPETVME